MPDITMCKDESCPKRKTCKRFISKSNPHWQSYFMVSPRTETGCEYYVVGKKDKD